MNVNYEQKNIRIHKWALASRLAASHIDFVFVNAALINAALQFDP
jgi:hypothetical protein